MRRLAVIAVGNVAMYLFSSFAAWDFAWLFKLDDWEDYRRACLLGAYIAANVGVWLAYDHFQRHP